MEVIYFCWHMVMKVFYLTITYPYIVYIVNVLNQFMYEPKKISLVGSLTNHDIPQAGVRVRTFL